MTQIYTDFFAFICGNLFNSRYPRSIPTVAKKV